MHIPDGFIDAPTSLAAGAVAVTGLAVCVHKTADSLEERDIAAGLTAAFVFAVQMLNFPVASGTSGHLLGGVLAAVLVGHTSAPSASRWCCSCRRCSSPTGG
ncbi:MAG: energy-coupling factor ABC transporter permease [Acidimicrobiales bacterium]